MLSLRIIVQSFPVYNNAYSFNKVGSISVISF